MELKSESNRTKEPSLHRPVRLSGETPRTDFVANKGYNANTYICEMTMLARTLEKENKTFRNAQKACEACGPNTARWEDGFPANLEAASEDAHAWLSYTQRRSKTLKMDCEHWDNLDRCMEALRGFMRPNETRSAHGEPATNLYT